MAGTAGLLSAPGPAHSRDRIEFRQSRLLVAGAIQTLVQTDIDGDGEADLLVFHRVSSETGLETERRFSAFLHPHRGDPPPAHPTVALNGGEILFDVGDLEGDGTPEIVFFREHGVVAYDFTEGRFSSFAELGNRIDPLPHAHDPAAIRRYRFLHDLDADGRLEMFIPSSDRIHVYAREDGAFALSRTLWTGSRIALAPPRGGFAYTTRLPEIYLYDTNADGRRDCLLIQQERLDLYLQQPSPGQENSESLIPPDFRYRFLVTNVNPSAFESITPSQVRLLPEDLNADGCVDLLLFKAPRAAVTKNISQVQVYLNEHGRFDSIPDQVLTTENISGDHIIADFNRDGRLDIGLLSFSMGFTQAARFLFTKRTSNAFELYTMREDGTYPSKPDHRVSFVRELRLDEIIAGAMCQSCEGDFTGDGLDDLIVGTDTRHLAVFSAEEGKFFSRKPGRKLGVPVSASHIVGDANGDGIADIVFWYPGKPGLENTITLLTSLRTQP